MEHFGVLEGSHLKEKESDFWSIVEELLRNYALKHAKLDNWGVSWSLEECLLQGDSAKRMLALKFVKIKAFCLVLLRLFQVDCVSLSAACSHVVSLGSLPLIRVSLRQEADFFHSFFGFGDY